MASRGRWLVVSALALASLVLASLGFAWSSPAGERGDARDLLPDLDQVAPGRIVISTRRGPDGPRFLLGFASAVDNVGEGPLEVLGERTSLSEPRMRVEQTVLRSDGSRRSQEIAGIIRYVKSETHQHWHFLGFDRYELLRADGARLLRDRKTGFCLGDRYRARSGLPNQPRFAVLTGECGRDEPELLQIREGISVGYGDDYKPTLEGQHFDLTGLPAGRYLLVHRANPERTLLESNYENNAASMLFRLRWPNGPRRPPRVDVLRRCADSDRCR